jgi:hypothetical protein
LIAAGLFVRTLANLQSIELGFMAERVLLMDVNASQAGHPPDEIAAFYANLRQRLAAVPGAAGVTLSHASLIRAGRSLNIFVGGKGAEGARVLTLVRTSSRRCECRCCKGVQLTSATCRAGRRLPW